MVASCDLMHQPENDGALTIGKLHGHVQLVCCAHRRKLRSALGKELVIVHRDI